MLVPIVRGMAVRARGFAFHQVFSTRPALRSSFEHSIGQGARARANDWTPTNRHRNSHSKHGDEAKYNREAYLKKSFHDHLEKLSDFLIQSLRCDEHAVRPRTA